MLKLFALLTFFARSANMKTNSPDKQMGLRIQEDSQYISSSCTRLQRETWMPLTSWRQDVSNCAPQLRQFSQRFCRPTVIYITDILLEFAYHLTYDSRLCIGNTQPSPQAFSARSILDSTVSCDVTERYTPRTPSQNCQIKYGGPFVRLLHLQPKVAENPSFEQGEFLCACHSEKQSFGFVKKDPQDQVLFNVSGLSRATTGISR